MPSRRRPGSPESSMWTRRDLLQRAAAAGSFALLPGCGKLVWDSALGVPPELADAVAALEEASSRKKAVEAASELLLGGLSTDDFHRALLHACCRQLTFEQLGHQAHPLWVVECAREIGRRGSPEDAVLASLHAVDLFKLEHRDSRGDRAQPGELGAVPEPDPVALEEAILAGDPDAADAHAVALLRAERIPELRATIARAAIANVGAIGHPAIHAAQVLRTLGDVGFDETVVRVLAWGLAHEIAGPEAVVGPWEANAARAAALPSGWDLGVDDVEGAIRLQRDLRTTDPDEAADVVARALAEGLGIDAVFDALGARGSELALSHVGKDGVFPGLHSVTGLDGIRWVFDTALDDDTRRRAVLQAASLLAVNDADGRERSGGTDDVRLDELAPIAGSSAAAVMDAAAEDRIEAARRLLGLAEEGGIGGFLEVQRAELLRVAVEEHELKLPVAAWIRAEQADPAMAGDVLAGALAYGSTPGDPDWDLLELARDTAARL